MLLPNCLAFAILHTTSDGEDRALTHPGRRKPRASRRLNTRCGLEGQPPSSVLLWASLPASLQNHSTSLPVPYLPYWDTPPQPSTWVAPWKDSGESWCPLRCWGSGGERGLPTCRGGASCLEWVRLRKPKEQTLSPAPLCDLPLQPQAPHPHPSPASLASSFSPAFFHTDPHEPDPPRTGLASPHFLLRGSPVRFPLSPIVSKCSPPQMLTF